MTPPRIWLSPPHIGSVEEAFVRDAFGSNWIAPLGPHVHGFETELCEVTATKHAVALSSGTAAIHLALMVLGVQRGDWVLCQSFTFAGTVNPVAYQDALPVLIDSEADTWNMDPEALLSAIKAAANLGIKPKAIIPVHLYGMPAKIADILSIARQYEIPVVEDAAEALGSSIDGNPCGSFGDLAVLSFNGNKIITTSGGGALLSNRAEWIETARFLSAQARDPAPHYQHSRIGYNYRLSNVLAAIGRGQLRVLSDRVRARRSNFERYRAFFVDIDGVSVLPEYAEAVFSNRWLTTILVDPHRSGGISRETIRLALAAENIEARPLWKPMHIQPVFKDAPFFGTGLSERLFGQGLCLPSGSSLTEDEFERIFDVLRTVFNVSAV
jgi:dTDP-4-amino-4,6-dideoxygalactose transaminase